MAQIVSAKISQDSINLPIDAEGKLTYQGVVKVDSTMKKAELYRKAREWFVNMSADSKQVLQLDDKAEGQLIGKGSRKYSIQMRGAYGIAFYESIPNKFTVKIESKDGKYRYKIYDISGESPAFSSLISTFLINYETDYKFYLTKVLPTLNTPYKKQYYKRNEQRLSGLDVEMKEIISSLEKAMRSPLSKDDF